MPRNPDKRTRIMMVERELASLTGQSTAIGHDREASVPNLNYAIVVTWTADVADYPTGDSYIPFVFADVSFDEAVGGATPTYTKLSQSKTRIGYSMGGYQPRDTPMIAIRQNQRWVLLPVGGGAEHWKGVADEEIASGAVGDVKLASADTDTVQAVNCGAETVNSNTVIEIWRWTNSSNPSYAFRKCPSNGLTVPGEDLEVFDLPPKPVSISTTILSVVTDVRCLADGSLMVSRADIRVLITPQMYAWTEAPKYKMAKVIDNGD